MKYRTIAAFEGFDVVEPFDPGKAAQDRHEKRSREKRRKAEERRSALIAGLFGVCFPLFLTACYVFMG